MSHHTPVSKFEILPKHNYIKVKRHKRGACAYVVWVLWLVLVPLPKAVQ